MIYIFFMINVESPFWSCRIEMELAYIFDLGLFLYFSVIPPATTAISGCDKNL